MAKKVKVAIDVKNNKKKMKSQSDTFYNKSINYLTNFYKNFDRK